MKKILLIGGALTSSAILGVAVFVATCHVDRYRPEIVQQLERALGVPVGLDRVVLRWRGGVCVALQGLTVYADHARQAEPLAQVEVVEAVVRVWPLLHRQVDVTSVTLRRPRVHVARDAQGRLNLLGLSVAATPAVSGRTAMLGHAPVTLRVATTRIIDGTVHWTDAAATPPGDLRATALDAQLRNISLDAPFDVEARAAVCSAAPNVQVTARVRLPSSGQIGVIEQGRVEAQLDQLQLAELARAVPALAGAGLQELRGRIVATIDRLPLDPQALTQAAARVQVSDGRVVLQSWHSPLEQMAVSALVRQNRIEVQQLVAHFAGGMVRASGTVESLSTQPQATIQAQADDLRLETLLPGATPEAPQLRGRLHLDMQGAARGLTWSQMRRSLTGQARVQWQEAEVAHLNVLRQVFERLSVLPGLADVLLSRLPPSYQEKLAATNTPLKPMDVTARLQDDALVLDRWSVATDEFELAGAGRVGWDGVLVLQGRLRIEPALSAACIKSVRELRALADADGWLTLPVDIGGVLPQVGVRPDVKYVAARLATSKLGELLGGGQPHEPAAGAPVTEPQGAPASTTDGAAPATDQPPQKPAAQLRSLIQQLLQPPPQDASQPAAAPAP